MKIRSIIFYLVLMILPMGLKAQSPALIASVYQDENITVRAGIVDVENRIIKFGDLLAYGD